MRLFIIYYNIHTLNHMYIIYCVLCIIMCPTDCPQITGIYQHLTQYNHPIT